MVIFLDGLAERIHIHFAKFRGTGDIEKVQGYHLHGIRRPLKSVQRPLHQGFLAAAWGGVYGGETFILNLRRQKVGSIAP